ncbi:response regulator transcription factor [Siminovitchia fordii]|uniref:Transcriptional regulatory protein YcbL n=1 Tax=Siminovitchia fordii TaxID=254759 RepID=A0ABQ4K1U5_9BACI|nr:response regulator transcription factor [Siminovitchia fordii]GIN18891.1 putative transcriptional regulatory protein YcbL [Siminovitchia fordii]
MEKRKILLVEDDIEISEMLNIHLTNEHYQVECAYDGEEAMEKFMNKYYDLILLDLMLPKLNGMDFLQLVRTKSFTPVMILSAKDSDVDKALGLGFGADDYVTKPFSMVELSARVKALIRRSTQYAEDKMPVASSIIQVHDIQLDRENHQVTKNGEMLNLTATEWAILCLFIEYPKKVFTKEQIYRSVWNEEYYGDENIINVHIRRLREKIEDNPSKPQYIKTLWGIGYKLGEFE